MCGINNINEYLVVDGDILGAGELRAIRSNKEGRGIKVDSM